jgi:hypothetical protein
VSLKTLSLLLRLIPFGGAEGGFWTNTAINRYTLGGDTVIRGKHYEKILAYAPSSMVAVTGGFVRNEGKKVFIISYDYMRRLSNEKLMYDFRSKLTKEFTAL